MASAAHWLMHAADRSMASGATRDPAYCRGTPVHDGTCPDGPTVGRGRMLTTKTEKATRQRGSKGEGPKSRKRKRVRRAQ